MSFQSNTRDETMTSCELNQIFIGEIASVQNYGAFVRIPGCKQQGLIHKSQVSAARVDDAADILHRGERIWCKVINIDRDGKVALSMKHVNQGDGRDLDPNGVQRETDERKRKTLAPGKRKVIELEAVLNTTCAKCGTRGHLATDCFVPLDGKRYRLLSEEPEKPEKPEKPECVARQPEVKTDTASCGKNERKKRSKKSKRRSDSSGDQESDRGDGDEVRPSSEERERRRRRKKKRSKESRPREKRSDGGKKRRRAESKDGCASNEKKSKKCKHSRSKYSD